MLRHKIVIGDSRRLSLVPDNTAELVITSPPYWQLKDYGTERQIGFNSSYEEYINNLNLVWLECYRVLASGCRMCINIGDQFARAVYYGRYKVIPIRTEIIRFCETIGMDYMGAIIWQKQTTMNTTGGGAVMGSFPYPRNGILKLDYEFILIFKKQGEAPKPTSKQKEESILTKEEWNTYFSSHWNFNGVRQLEHIAMFPEELPSRLIKMFSFVGETVFDPFLGSGTTALAASKLGRNSIGYEINSDFLPVIKQKLNAKQASWENSYEFARDNSEIAEFNFSSLPYKFTDPLKLDNKIDVKKLNYGSKIDGSDKPCEIFYTVSDVISPEKLKLSGGVNVRLIGVKNKDGKDELAAAFLREKLRGRKVFMRHDKEKYDSENNLLCYLYLDNKTFINAHLIKNGFADADLQSEYAKKENFRKLTND